MSQVSTSVVAREGVPSMLGPARQVSLLRLLLLALGLGVVTFGFDARISELALAAHEKAVLLLFAVSLIAAALAVAVRWLHQRWQLALQLVFDLLWTGLLLFLTGGVGSPGVVILFAVILIGTLVLPGVLPFVLPSLASLILATLATLYVARLAPFPIELYRDMPAWVDPNRVLGLLATQVAALFLVDLLGQLLARRLTEHRIFTREVLDQLGEGVVAVDQLGAIAYANSEALRLLGLGTTVVIGRRLAEVITAEELAPIRAWLGQPSVPDLQRFTGIDRRQLVLRLTGLVDRRGRPTGQVLLIADETRLRLLEESAHRSERLAALGEMAAGIAHEVRNPLTSLRGCAQELADINRKEGQHDAADLAAIMIGEADRLAQIVEDFLTLSRMRAPQREPLALDDVFSGLDSLYRQRRDVAGTLIVFAVAPDTPPAFADSGQLLQVLTNLINNAIDAVRGVPAPRIAVSVRASPSDNPLGMPAVEIAIQDNGCGIPNEIQEHVFTPFFSTKPSGTGLGLSLVQRIVREHEGLLQLDSAPERGTTVRIYLPSHSQTRVFLRALGQK